MFLREALLDSLLSLPIWEGGAGVDILAYTSGLEDKSYGWGYFHDDALLLMFLC